jgi:hypothetical protein
MELWKQCFYVKLDSFSELNNDYFDVEAKWRFFKKDLLKVRELNCFITKLNLMII